MPAPVASPIRPAAAANTPLVRAGTVPTVAPSRLTGGRGLGQVLTTPDVRYQFSRSPASTPVGTPIRRAAAGRAPDGLSISTVRMPARAAVGQPTSPATLIREPAATAVPGRPAPPVFIRNAQAATVVRASSRSVPAASGGPAQRERATVSTSATPALRPMATTGRVASPPTNGRATTPLLAASLPSRHWSAEAAAERSSPAGLTLGAAGTLGSVVPTVPPRTPLNVPRVSSPEVSTRERQLHRPYIHGRSGGGA